MASSPSPIPATLKTQARRVVRLLAELYPEAVCALNHRDAYELIAATILSAQCTDARVNLVTPALFARYPDPAALAAADPADVEALIHSTGFFRNKARNLIGMAAALVADHAGRVPADLEALTALPGVGRKTANVVMGTAFGIPSGVVVDTHVKRLAYRMGLTSATDPVVIERELNALIPRGGWIALSHRMILHGRAVCVAQRPRCGVCSLARICPRRGVTSFSES